MAKQTIKLTKAQIRKKCSEMQQFLYDLLNRYPAESTHRQYLFNCYSQLLMYRSRVDADKHMKSFGYDGYEDCLDKVKK
mgnify:CR=1 FL=1